MGVYIQSNLCRETTQYWEGQTSYKQVNYDNNRPHSFCYTEGTLETEPTMLSFINEPIIISEFSQ